MKTMDNSGDENQRLKIALDATDTGVWEWDLQSDEVVWDERMNRLFGYKTDGFPGNYEGFAIRVHPEDLPRVEAAHERGMEEGFYEAIFRVAKNGKILRWVKARAEVEYEDGEPSNMIGIVTDISDEKETELHLKEQNERLEEFANIVSHDLRNPLNVAQLHLDLLADESASEHIEKIRNAHERMERLIDHMLVVAHEGISAESTESVNLASIVRTCWRAVDTKNATLCNDTNRTINAKRTSLEQLFENLIRNAVEHGGSDVSVIVGKLPDGFYIEDDGAGIPERMRVDVWNSGYTTNQAGTGYGLPLVARIVEAHGWDIRLTNSEAGGARFEITGVETEI